MCTVHHIQSRVQLKPRSCKPTLCTWDGGRARQEDRAIVGVDDENGRWAGAVEWGPSFVVSAALDFDIDVDDDNCLSTSTPSGLCILHER